MDDDARMGGGWRLVFWSALLSAAIGLSVSGCYSLRPSAGGGRTDFMPPRVTDPGDVMSGEAD